MVKASKLRSQINQKIIIEKIKKMNTKMKRLKDLRQSKIGEKVICVTREAMVC